MMSRKNQNTTTSFMEWNNFVSLITRLEKDKNYKYCLLISIGVFTGLRISDLLTLKYNDLLNKEVFTIREKKTGKERCIKISKDLKDIISRIVEKLKIKDVKEFIFINKYKTKPIDKSYVNVQIKRDFQKVSY